MRVCLSSFVTSCFFASSLAAACPQFTGSYVCENQVEGGKVHLKIEQKKDKDGVTIITEEDSEIDKETGKPIPSSTITSEYVVDGEWHEEDDDIVGVPLKVKYRSVCKKDKRHMTYVTTVDFGTPEEAVFTAKVEEYLTKEGFATKGALESKSKKLKEVKKVSLNCVRS